MGELQELLYELFDIEYDPDEIRWCVSADIDGKTDWFETIHDWLALAMAEELGRLGYAASIQRLTRREIRERFGDPEFTAFGKSNTGEFIGAAVDLGDSNRTVFWGD